MDLFYVDEVSSHDLLLLQLDDPVAASAFACRRAPAQLITPGIPLIIMGFPLAAYDVADSQVGHHVLAIQGGR